MATCPNKNLDEWKSLVASRGENIAYYLWDKYEGEVPVSEYGTRQKGLFNLIIEDVENFNPRNFPNEVRRIVGLIENKLKIKTRNFVSANIPSYTNKKEYLDSVFKSLLENIGLPSEINTFSELKRQLNSGEVEQYVRSQYDFYKREIQKDFDNRKPTPSIIVLENFLKDPTIYDRYDDKQQTFVRSAFPVLFGDLGRYKSYNQALGHYKSKMRLDTFRRQVTSSENFARGRFYSLNARMKKFETLVNYLTLEPIDFKNRIYDMITNEVRRRSEFYETAPVKASVEKQLAQEKEWKYQNSVKYFLETFSKNDNTISGRIAKVFLNHPKTLNAISLENITRTMFLGGGTWSTDGSISVLYKDSNGLKHTLLHELTHHFTVPYMHLFYEKEMYDKSWYKKNPERLQKLDSEADAPGKYLFRELSEQEIANLKKIDAIYRHVVDLKKSGKIEFNNGPWVGNAEYGLTNAMEFMAEVISNPYFAAKIAEQPSIYNKQSNLLRDIIDAIFSMFGIVKDGNLLNDVYSVFEETFLGKDDKYTFGDNLKKDEQLETVDAYQQMFQLEETSVVARGEDVAFYLWDKYEGNVPEFESRIGIVKSELKAVNILQSPKADQFFNAVAKNKISGDFFWRKMQADLGIPKDQLEILKSFNTEDKGELISSLLANYSFAIEINTAKEEILKGGNLTINTLDETSIKKINNVETSYNVSDSGDNVGKYYIEYFDNNNQPAFNIYKTYNDAINDIKTKGRRNNSQYYSNLTVPGGTNYTENEIATPTITPSIKGHAQFATDQGIGWFRSDEQDKVERKPITSVNQLPNRFTGVNDYTYTKVQGGWLAEHPQYESTLETNGKELVEIYNYGSQAYKGSKTRRILELQSDLFQKGREKKDLAKVTGERDFVIGEDGLPIYKNSIIENKGFEKQNQFLQLLNKDNNWVTFFVKSIIQDSAKKGYEKVLFPSGNTASKIEGHTTLEEFKKQQEDRIKELEKEQESLPFLNDISKELKHDWKEYTYRIEPNENNDFFGGELKILKKGEKEVSIEFISFEDGQGDTLTREENNEQIEKLMSLAGEPIVKDNNIKGLVISRPKVKEDLNNQINQLKQELERVDRQGFGALKPVYNFYETTVTNILKKQGYNPKEVRDEYGNTWNEIEIVPERENQPILFQLEDSKMSTASPEILSKVKDILKKMGVNVESLTDYAKKSSIKVSGVNAVADLVKGVIAVAEGKEDVALTEEMVHIATAIIEQKNPTLVTEMIAKIDRFKIYKQTLEQYRNNKYYQLPNGKPDIRKIKKEAVDRLITELIVNGGANNLEFPELQQEENTSLIRRWWNVITDFFRGMYKSANIDIFQEAATQIMEGGIEGQVSDVINKTIYAQRQAPYIKEGVEELFNTNPELAEIGSPELYSQYLDTIFPDSKVKDIVYHGTDTKFDKFNKKAVNKLRGKSNTEFIHFTKSFDLAMDYSAQALGYADASDMYKKSPEKMDELMVVLPVLINGNKLIKENVEYGSKFELKQKGIDIDNSIFSFGYDLAVFEPEQIHILGTKQDIEGFRQFVETRASGEGIFFQLAEPTKAQKDVQRRILETKESLRNAAQDTSVDLLTLGDPDASNFYENRQPDGTWKPVIKRVTDRVKAWYKRKFGELQFTKEEKEFNEFKRTLGVKYHGYFKEIHDRYFNSDGTRRQKTEPRPDIRDQVDNDIYSKLETYYVNLIDSKAKGGKNLLVFAEVKVYDPIEKEAGSIDLLIVDEDGTANIIDWKFMTIAEGQKDVQWYKQEAYGIQLARYRDMLLSGYGVKKVSMNRAIPILFQIKPASKKVEGAKPLLTGINIGSANPLEIEDLRLLPISEKTESTGYENLDEFLGQLNAVLDKIAKKKATTDVEKEFKKERLNVLREAIRIAQGTLNIKPVVDVLMVMKKEGDQLINDYNMIYKDADPRSNDFTNKQLSDFSSDLRDYISIAKVFGRISDKIGDLIYNESMEEMDLSEEDLSNRKELLSDLRNQSENIRISRDRVFDIAGKFADKYIGIRNLISGLMNPEAVVKGLGALFRSVSDIPLRSVKILNKLVENARLKASRDAVQDVDKLMKIREKLTARGGDLRKLVQQIYQKDEKGNLVNKLIYRYNQEFSDGIKNNALEGQRNIKWIRENVDVAAYEKEVVPLMEKRIAQIKKDYAGNEEMKERLIEQTINKWDIKRPRFNGWDNYILMRHPLPKWESNEYLELKKDKELFELYEFISGVNDKAKEARYLENQATSVFLPWVRKSMAESLAWDFSLSTVMNFGNRLSIKADEVGRGKIDALTKELENGIPKYYAADFTSFPDSDLTMADVSEDLFANMILYINDMNKYKYLSEVEGQLELIKTLEKFKEHHLETSKNGQVVIKNGVPSKEEGNEENFKIYDQFMRAVLYDQKYPLDDTDVTMSTSVGNYMKKAVNNVSKHFGGKEVFTIDDNPDSISLVKSIETMNRFFQLKALGLEFVSGAVNWFGTNVQLAAQSGTYFNSTEVLKKQYQILGNKMDEEKRNLLIEFINEFMPLREDPNYENLQKAGMTQLTRKNFGDMLMIFMRLPEQFTEKAVFMTLLDNVIVQDGKFENIRKVVRQKYAAERATASLTRLKEIDKAIENDVKELKKQSVGTTAKIENGKLVIPGFDMSNRDEINRLTSLTRNISTSATGGINQQNLNRAQMNIWIKSAMVFKGWIPGLAFTRFDHLRKVSDDFSVTIKEDGTTEGERYDIGRLRLFFYVAGTSIVQMSNNINNLLTLNEKGLAEFDRMYTKFAEKYYLREGEPLNMTREEFIDLIRTNLRNQMNELALTLALVSTSFSMGLIGPDDDDTKAEKNAFRYSQRVIDKFVSELTFFINPFEFQNILEGNLLPAIGVVTDITRFFTHLTMEVTGLDITDPTKSFEEVQKNAQPIKNLAKMFPISKSMINYWAMIDEEFAKEFDITIQKESGR